MTTLHKPAIEDNRVKMRISTLNSHLSFLWLLSRYVTKNGR